jgi:hypothetical protein
VKLSKAQREGREREREKERDREREGEGLLLKHSMKERKEQE